MNQKGILFGIGAYALWGFFPIYWKVLHEVPALQIVAHRLAWSLVFLLVLIAFKSDWKGLKAALNRRTLAVYSLAACVLTFNWLIYVWAVNSGFVIETSLGYFINPLVNVLLGVVFLRERLTLSRWVPVGLATLGVLYLTVSIGKLPWISLALAFSFGFYGLLKKISPMSSLHGLTVETSILFLPAVGYLLWVESQGTGSFGHASLLVNTFIAFAGLVTAVPLLLFAAAARSIPLSTLGLLQYIAPSVQFLLGLFLYHEPFTLERLIGFSLIWLALLVLTGWGYLERRRQLQTAACD